MEELEHKNDPFLTCCLCSNLLQNPLQLTCLHNCCQPCFDAALSENNRQDVTCGSCRTNTPAGSQFPNSFVNQQVQQNLSISESRTCGICKENDESTAEAVVWCPVCRHSLCGSCLAVHRQYYRKHVTESLDELKSLEDLYPRSSSSVCAIHARPLEIACLGCEQAKCLSCWAECKNSNHEMHVIGDSSFDDYINKFVASISSLEEELLSKSEVLEKPKSMLAELKVARARHLEQISQRKRLIVDAVEEAYQHIEFSTKNTYDDLEKTAEEASASSDNISSNMADARNYIRRLIESNRKCEILNQQRVVRQRLEYLSAELDTLRATMNTIRAVNIDSSMPDNLLNIVKKWIGMPVLLAATNCSTNVPLASPPRPTPLHFSFGVASVTVQLPVECYDVALTMEGRLLLAAAEHGLLEFCSSSGRELCRWLPPNKIDNRLDEVQTVAALSDERAAAGLYLGQVIVVLRRIKAQLGLGVDQWILVQRLDQMPWRPMLISAHGEMLAVAEYSASYRRLLLTSVSTSWRRLRAEKGIEYFIGGLAITALAVVTASSHGVKLSGDRQAYVIDAYSFAQNDKLLWRHELNSVDEHLRGICTNSIGSVLFAALCNAENTGGRVMTISMTDGSELQRIALSFDGGSLLQPKLISLSDEAARSQQQQQQSENLPQNIESSGSCGSTSSGAVLAVLSWDPKTGQHRTVTVHRSI